MISLYLWSAFTCPHCGTLLFTTGFLESPNVAVCFLESTRRLQLTVVSPHHLKLHVFHSWTIETYRIRVWACLDVHCGRTDQNSGTGRGGGQN